MKCQLTPMTASCQCDVKLGFPVLNIASTIQMLIQMYFLLMFYTNILGISGTAAGHHRDAGPHLGFYQ